MRLLIYVFIAIGFIMRFLPKRRGRRRIPQPPMFVAARHRSTPLRPMRVPWTGSTATRRSVGYCEQTDCENYAKGVFLLNHGQHFYCPRCREPGRMVRERGHYEGSSNVFKEVRCEFNYDPLNDKYREIGIVRDDSLWGDHNVYTLQSPLIKTEKRALKVAEAILANLNRGGGVVQGEVPHTNEVILSFDDSPEDFSRKLAVLAKEWENSSISQGRRA